MLELNLTLVFQMVGFFALLIILNQFLYKPLLKILKEREEKIEGTLKSAAKAEKDIDDGMAAYEKRLKEATIKGTEARNKMKSEGLQKEKEIIEAARSSATAEIGRMQTELVKSKAAALHSLRAETESISKNIAEKILDRKLVIFILTFALPLLPALVFASEGGGHAEEHGSMFNMKFVWSVVNFVILAVGIVVIWKKLLSGMLHKRGVEIKKALEDAKTAKEAADRKSDEYRTKLAMLEKRLSEIQKELEIEGDAEKKRIVAEAENAAVKIKEQARLSAEQELKKAKLEIKEEVASLAVQMAETILKKELSSSDQEKLVKGYLNNLRLN